MVAQVRFSLFTNACDNETLLPEHRLRKINKMEVKRVRVNKAKRLDTAYAFLCVRVFVCVCLCVCVCVFVCVCVCVCVYARSLS